LNYPDAQHLQALISVFLRAGGLAAGREEDEAELLWSAALREAPRMQTPFDSAWWAGLMAPRRSTAERGIAPVPVASTAQAPPRGRHERLQDWGEAPDVSEFQGRADELETLHRWVVQDRGRLVAVLGMGGIGKTMLAARLAQDVARDFDRVYWRSMRNAPLVEEWLAGALGFLSDQQAVPDGEAARLTRLVPLLRERRCLLVIDNMETLLESGRSEGNFRDGYGGYARVLQAIGQSSHQSCLIATSRELSSQFAELSGSPAVRTLELRGLNVGEAQALLADKQLLADEPTWAMLTARFGGNSLALRIAGENIRQIFGGDVSAFFDQAGSSTVFGGIRRLIDEQVERSSPLEQDVLTRLAIEREPIAVADVLADLSAHVGTGPALDAIEALRRRSLVERVDGGAAFTLQSVVLEYGTERLVERVSEEVAHRQPHELIQRPLIKARGKEYVRQSQERLIGQPILQQLVAASGASGAERRLLDLLDDWRAREQTEHGYGPGNVVNLLRLLRGNLRGLDLSHLWIRQAYLQSLEAQDASLVDARLSESLFGQSFDAVTCVQISSDGSRVAAGTLSGELRGWRVSDHAALLAVHGHAGVVTDLVVSADERTLATASLDGTVRLWTADRGDLIATLQGHAGGAQRVALSADGRSVVSGGYDGTVRVWAVDGGELLATLEGHTGSVWGVAVSGDGSMLVSGGLDGTIRVWTRNGAQTNAHARWSQMVFEGHDGAVRDVKLSANEQMIVSGGHDGSVRLWSFDKLRMSGQQLGILRGHAGDVCSVALSPDGQIIASGGVDGTVRLWEAPSGRPVAVMQGHTGTVTSVALSAGGGLVASGGLDATVRLWELPGGRPVATLQGVSRVVTGVALDADAKLAASASFDGSVRIWDTEDGGLRATLRGHTGAVYGMALSADGEQLASVGHDRTVRLWSVDRLRMSGHLLATLQGHTDAVQGVACSADGRIVISGGEDALIRVWSFDRLRMSGGGRHIRTLQGHTDNIRSVACSADGRIVVSGGFDATVRVWNSETGESLATLRDHTGWVSGVAISADGRTIGSGGFDRTVRLWSVDKLKMSGHLPSSECLATLEGHTGGVWSVALSPDGLKIVSGGDDGTVRLWDTHTHACLATLEGHTGGVSSVALSADGRIIASGGVDGTLKLWDSTNFSLLRTLRPDRRFERLDITGLTVVVEQQRTALLTLGAVERGS
jgi:WD40 repeat protein